MTLERSLRRAYRRQRGSYSPMVTDRERELAARHVRRLERRAYRDLPYPDAVALIADCHLYPTGEG